jgi:hypothetical protein
MSDPIEEIRLRANAAQRGPWGWFGNAKYEFFLSTKDRGRIFVMQFGRMGMQSAQPCFNVNGRGMTDGRELAIYEVNRNATDFNDPSLYRHDIVGFRHPDAEFIAHSRQDVDVLLAEIDRLRELTADTREDAA